MSEAELYSPKLVAADAIPRQKLNLSANLTSTEREGFLLVEEYLRPITIMQRLHLGEQIAKLGPAADKALLSTFERATNGEELIDLLQLLVTSRRAALVPAVLKVIKEGNLEALSNSQKERFKSVIVNVLAESRSKEALDILLAERFLEVDIPLDARALRKFRDANESMRNRIVTALLEQMGAKNYVGQEVTSTLGELLPVGRVKELGALVRGGDTRSKTAASALGASKLPSAHQELLRLVGSSDPLILETAIRAAGYTGDERFEDAALSASQSANLGVRLAALETLRRVGTERSVTRLLDVAKQGSLPERGAALRALAELPGEQARKALVQCLNSADSSLQVTAILQVGGRYDLDAELIALSKDADPDIRGAALESLVNTATAKGFKRLRDLVADRNAPNNERIATLRMLADSVSYQDTDLAEALLREKDPLLRLQALGITPTLPESRWLPVLLSTIATGGDKDRSRALEIAHLRLHSTSTQGKESIRDSIIARAHAGGPIDETGLQIVGQIGGEEAVQFLLGLTQAERELFPPSYATALAGTRDPRAVQEMIARARYSNPELLKSDRRTLTPHVRELGSMDDPKAREFTLRLLTDNALSEEACEMVANNYSEMSLANLRVAARSPILSEENRLKIRVKIDLIEQFVTDAESFPRASSSQRVRYLANVASRKDAGSLLALQSALETGSREEQELAGSALIQRSKELSREIAERYLKSSDPLLRRIGAGIATKRALEAKDDLTQKVLLESSDPLIRIAANAVVYRSAEERKDRTLEQRSLLSLLSGLGSTDIGVKSLAIMHLQEIKNPRIARFLAAKYISTDSTSQRIELGMALHAMKEKLAPKVSFDEFVNAQLDKNPSESARAFRDLLTRAPGAGFQNGAKMSAEDLRFVLSERNRYERSLNDPQRPFIKPEDETAVVFLPRVDENGAVIQASRLIEDLRRAGVRVAVFEIDTDEEFLKRAEQFIAREYKTDYVFVVGHGSESATSFGDADPAVGVSIGDERKNFSLYDASKVAGRGIGRMLKTDGRVFVISCSNGQGRHEEKNMADFYSRYLFRSEIRGPVITADEPTNINGLRRENGRFTEPEYFGGSESAYRTDE